MNINVSTLYTRTIENVHLDPCHSNTALSSAVDSRVVVYNELRDIVKQLRNFNAFKKHVSTKV